MGWDRVVAECSVDHHANSVRLIAIYRKQPETSLRRVIIAYSGLRIDQRLPGDWRTDRHQLPLRAHQQKDDKKHSFKYPRRATTTDDRELRKLPTRRKRR